MQSDSLRDLSLEEDFIGASGHGDPLPPLLNTVTQVLDEDKLIFSPTKPVSYNESHRELKQSQRSKDNNISFKQPAYGFTGNKSQDYYPTKELTMNSSRNLEINHESRIESSPTSNTSLTSHSSSSDFSTHLPHTHGRHAEQIDTGRKDLHMTSPIVRKRVSGGKCGEKNPALEHRELAFGPVWLDGTSDPIKRRASEQPSSGRSASFDLQYRDSSIINCYKNQSDSRNTITVDSEPSRTGAGVQNSSTRRRTIAPIGSLDDQIRQRKNQRQVRSHTLPEGSLQHDIKGSPILARAATLHECISEEPEELPEKQESESPVSPISKHLLEDITDAKRSDSLPNLPTNPASEIEVFGHSGPVTDMKSAFKKMRSRLSPSQQILLPTPLKPPERSPSKDPLSLKDSRERLTNSFSMRSSVDSRKRSGSFGSRMIRRAKSVVTRQPSKNLEDDKQGVTLGSPRLKSRSFKKQTSLNESFMNQGQRRTTSSPNDYSVMKPNSFDASFYEDNTSVTSTTDPDSESQSGSGSFPNILMQGDLYRRKRLVWSRTWAVLTADRILTMYKSKEDFETSRRNWSRMQGRGNGIPGTLKKTQTIGDYSSGPAFSPSAVLSIINLAGGCEIENVVQGKKATSFQIIPHSYHGLSQGGATTLPLGVGYSGSIKPVHLMCKCNDEFLYWVKALVQLNTNNSTRNFHLTQKNRVDLGAVPAQERRQQFSEQKKSPLSRRQESSEEVVLDDSKRQLFIQDSSMSRGSADGIHGNSDCDFRGENGGQDHDGTLDSPVSARSSISQGIDELPYIDDDNIDHVSEGVRIVADHNDNISKTKSPLTPRSVFNFSQSEKVEDSLVVEGRQASSPSQNSINSLADKREKIDKLRQKLKPTDDLDEVELKRCSITEKLNMRKAQIVGVAETSNAVIKTSRGVKGEKTLKNSRSPSEGAGFNEPDKQVKTGESANRTIITSVDREHGNTNTSPIEVGHAKQSERIHVSKTNKQTRSRDKRSGEKRQKEKKNLISAHSRCEEQTIQSLPNESTDKAAGISSSDGQIYRDDRAANENIDSGVGSVKDKQFDSTNIGSSRECESSQVREKLHSLHSEGRGNQFKQFKSIGEEDSIGVPIVDELTNSSISYLNPALPRPDRNSIRHLKSRSKALNSVRKQKSLRQTVLRKLGSRGSLSNSTPDLNSAVDSDVDTSLDILDSSEEPVSSSHPGYTIHLRRNTAFRQKRRASSPVVGIRSLSEGDLLGAVEDEVDGGDMRTFKNVRKISQDNFLETYGVIPRKKTGKLAHNTKRHTTYEDNKNTEDLPGFSLFVDEIQDDFLVNANHRILGHSDSSSSENSSYHGSLTNSEPQTREIPESTRKASLSKYPSHGDLNNAQVVKRPKSTGSDDSGVKLTIKDESRNSWLASLTPHFGRKANKTPSASKNSTQVSRRAVFHIPASQLASAAHRGYLDRRNKKRQWERFWCVLQDSCLYCYNSPQSDNTKDAVVLRGYDVVADVTNMNRSRFSIRLERNGSPTLHFSSENHQQFLLWVGTLEKETRNVLANTSDNEVLVNSVKATTNSNRHDNANLHEENSKSKSEEVPVEQKSYETQKEHLLREVLAHQQKFIDDQKMLQQRNANVSLSPLPDFTSKKLSKNQVNEKYSRAKEDEEMKMMKTLTHLNRRRNSAQLKVDQITKQLAPKSGRKRRENPHQFADMETKLRELQERLATVDKEIQEKHVLKQDVMEKIQQRRDLELLVLEQQESLAIIRKHKAQQKRAAFVEQTQPTQGNNDRLASIDEMSSISDCSSTSSNSLPDPLTLGIDTHLQAMSTPRQVRSSEQTNHTVSDVESCFHHRTGSDLDEIMSQGNSSIDGALSDDFRSISVSSEEPDRMSNIYHRTMSTTSVTSASSIEEQCSKRNTVDPTVLAEIEDFQLFSKQKLARISSKN